MILDYFKYSYKENQKKTNIAPDKKIPKYYSNNK